MNENEFNELSTKLKQIVKTIPLAWGCVQNDELDKKLSIFKYPNYVEFETAIADFSDNDKKYFKRRWYMWQCSKCDEYLFYKNDNVERNKNERDKEYDIIINGSLKFDVKGTQLPSKYFNRVDEIMANPQELINEYYEKQSSDTRYGLQNRLFIVHHSFVDTHRSIYLRCAWNKKNECYRDFSENIDNVKLFDYNGCTAGIIFILEREYRVASYFFPNNY